MSIGLSTALSGVAAANERWRAADSQSGTTAADGRRAQARATERGSALSRPESANDAAAARQARQRETESSDAMPTADAVVHQKSATYAFVANLRVLESQMNTSGVLLDIQA